MPFWCGACREYFSVKSHSVMHRSKLPLRIWGMAIYLMTTHLRGVSSMRRFVTSRTAETATGYTDDAIAYRRIPRSHESVNHSEREYVRDEVHTNGNESFLGQPEAVVQGNVLLVERETPAPLPCGALRAPQQPLRPVLMHGQRFTCPQQGFRAGG